MKAQLTMDIYAGQGEYVKRGAVGTIVGTFDDEYVFRTAGGKEIVVCPIEFRVLG